MVKKRLRSRTNLRMDVIHLERREGWSGCRKGKEKDLGSREKTMLVGKRKVKKSAGRKERKEITVTRR